MKERAKEELRWINIFLRDIFLIFVVAVVNYWTHFRVWWMGVLTGMLIVYVSWQFTDYLNYKRALQKL